MFLTGADPVARAGRQPEPAGRQRHRRDHVERGAGAEAAGAPVRPGPDGDDHRRARQSDQSQRRGATRELQPAARALGLKLELLDRERDFDGVFARLAELKAGLVIGTDGLFHQPRRAARRAGSPPCGAGDLPVSRLRGGRRPDELRRQPDRHVSPPESIPAASSRARSRPTCRCRSPRSS